MDHSRTEADPLTEAEILRYSRQILLREVGGRGQRVLLESSYRLEETELPCLAIAEVYLSAGGVGGRGRAASGVVGSASGPYAGPGPWVAVQKVGGGTRILYRSSRGCVACFHRALSLSPLEPAIGEGPSEVRSGSLIALVYQRLLLGLGPDLGRVWVQANGMEHEAIICQTPGE